MSIKSFIRKDFSARSLVWKVVEPSNSIVHHKYRRQYRKSFITLTSGVYTNIMFYQDWIKSNLKPWFQTQALNLLTKTNKNNAIIKFFVKIFSLLGLEYLSLFNTFIYKIAMIVALAQPPNLYTKWVCLMFARMFIWIFVLSNK